MYSLLLLAIFYCFHILADVCPQFYNSDQNTSNKRTRIQKNVTNIPTQSTTYVGTGYASEISPFKVPLATDSLLSCSGLAVINHRLKKHALFHVFMTGAETPKKRSTAIFETFKYWGNDFLDGAEIYLIPGRAYSDSKTLALELLKYIRRYAKNYAINIESAALVESSEHYEAKVAIANGRLLILKNNVHLDRSLTDNTFWPRENYVRKFGDPNDLNDK